MSHWRIMGQKMRNVQRFRGGLVFKAHRLCHSTLGLKVIKKKSLPGGGCAVSNENCVHEACMKGAVLLERGWAACRGEAR